MSVSLALQRRMRHSSLRRWLPLGFNSWRQGYSRDAEAQDSWHRLAVSYQIVAIHPSLEEQGFTFFLGHLAMVVRQIHGELSYALTALATWDQFQAKPWLWRGKWREQKKGSVPSSSVVQTRWDCSVGSVSFAQLRKWEGRGDEVTKTFQPRGGRLKHDSQKSGSAFQLSQWCLRLQQQHCSQTPWVQVIYSLSPSGFHPFWLSVCSLRNIIQTPLYWMPIIFLGFLCLCSALIVICLT